MKRILAILLVLLISAQADACLRRGVFKRSCCASARVVERCCPCGCDDCACGTGSACCLCECDDCTCPRCPVARTTGPDSSRASSCPDSTSNSCCEELPEPTKCPRKPDREKHFGWVGNGQKFEVYRGHDGWRWRLRAANHKIIAESGEAYQRLDKCLRAVELVKQSNRAMVVTRD